MTRATPRPTPRAVIRSAMPGFIFICVLLALPSSAAAGRI